MPLICCETGQNLELVKTLMTVSHHDSRFYSAVSAEVFIPIPKSHRRRNPCKPGDGGVNIRSSRTIGGGFKVEFEFSLAKETAERWLPKYIELYQVSVRAALPT